MSKVTSDVSMTFRLPLDLRERLQRIGDADDRSVSYVIKEMLQRFIPLAEEQAGIKVVE